MDYLKHYEALVGKARKRLIVGYVEKHHILPKCCGGSDDEDNLVRLTPEEHYVAHQLLVRIYPGNCGLVYALWKMGHGRQNNKMYGWVRRLYAQTVSSRVVAASTRAKFSQLWSGSGNPMYQKPSPCGMKGKNHSDATKTKMAEAAKKSWTSERKAAMSAMMSGSNSPLYGKPVSDATRQKLSSSRIGKKNSMFGKSAVVGRRWMVKPDQPAQLVKSEQIVEMLKLGWKEGRK